MKRKSGFTLVEMLIVVVIIGILASSILPRITGAISRARDVQRHADMRNIVAGINMYYNNYGAIPLSQEKQVVYLGSELEPYLSDYMKDIPVGPRKNSQILLYYYMDTVDRLQPNLRKKNGEYWYRKMYKPGNPNQVAALLVSKVENPDYANYVFKEKKNRDVVPGGSLWLGLEYRYSRGKTIDNVYLCSKVGDRVKKGEERVADENNTECTYSSEDQLYYIIKIE